MLFRSDSKFSKKNKDKPNQSISNQSNCNPIIKDHDSYLSNNINNLISDFAYPLRLNKKYANEIIPNYEKKKSFTKKMTDDKEKLNISNSYILNILKNHK